MILLNFSGTFQHVRVLNSPAHAFGVTNKATLTISHVTIDNSLGNLPNLLSGLKPAGHNTDGFNVLANDVTIKDSVVINQDDCIAIASGNNINILRNKCVGGHGISIGSIITGRAVSNVLIAGNYLVSSEQALRIKTFAGATRWGNNEGHSGASGLASSSIKVIPQFSVRPEVASKSSFEPPQGVTFTGTNVITVLPRAAMVEVNCVPGDCSGTWDWAGLKVYGGRIGTHMYSGIINFRQ
ncbi:unnamed protein product [Rhizoctonia solani]|nr:unnamed protein product [Rhizoctonia solani]